MGITPMFSLRRQKIRFAVAVEALQMNENAW